MPPKPPLIRSAWAKLYGMTGVRVRLRARRQKGGRHLPDQVSHARCQRGIRLAVTARPGRLKWPSEALQVLLKKGNDPAGAKAAAKAAPTVKLLAERFLTEHAEAKRA